MASSGVVRAWSDEEGWGVLDLPDTPGGCWAHYSVLFIEGYKRLEAGQNIEVEWEAADQDGYAFRAVRVWLAGTTPYADDRAPRLPEPGSPEAFGSELRFS